MDQEAQWVSEVKKGNKQAFKAVYDQYADKIFYVGLHFHLDQEEAKEMVQEVFLTLWEKRIILKEHLSLNAFLLTITKNKIINLQKKKAAEHAHIQKYTRCHATFSSVTEDDVITSDLKNYTARFINSLPTRQKQIYLLSREESFSNDEIAHHLHISKRTVENNIYQAEKSIRHFLQVNQLVVKSLLFFLFWLGFR